jgi:hypothetical protein
VSRRSAKIIACHSGEKMAYGQNAAVLRVIRGVSEQSEWWGHSLCQDPTKQGIGISRAFDEHSIRLVLRQRCNQGTGGARPVVANAEHLHQAVLRRRAPLQGSTT